MGMKKIIRISDKSKAQEETKKVSFKTFKKDPETKKVTLTEEKVYEALSSVRDPELPVNIVELGLIYDVKISDENNVEIKMTLTTPGCAMASSIASQAEEALKKAGAENILVQIVWDPPWNPDMISEEAKKKLGISEQ